MAKIFTEEPYMTNGRKLSMLSNWDHIKAIFGQYQGNNLSIYTISVLLAVWDGSDFCWIVFKWDKEQRNRHTKNLKLFGTNVQISLEYIQKIWERTGVIMDNIFSIMNWGNEQSDRHTRNLKLFIISLQTS